MTLGQAAPEVGISKGAVSGRHLGSTFPYPSKVANVIDTFIQMKKLRQKHFS